MKVFTCIDFQGRYVPGCAVVVAESEDAARNMLTAELTGMGLDLSRGFTLKELDPTTPTVVVLNAGDP